jgi:hypothetical protein
MGSKLKKGTEPEKSEVGEIPFLWGLYILFDATYGGLVYQLILSGIVVLTL